MGVMSCSRYECDNIMCDTYIDGAGYVCYDCQNEFKEYIERGSVEHTHEGQILRILKSFMITPKNSYNKGKEISVDDFFRGYTK